MIRINNIKLDFAKDNIDNLKKTISQKLNISLETIKELKINKKSLDARNKKNIKYIYEVDIDIIDEKSILKKQKEISLTPNEEYIYPQKGSIKLEKKPIIVGSGPAGLFCALILAEQGYKPIIIERGEQVEQRIKTVDKFWNTGELNTESNVQFGEGGAGTFSDGKLNTLTKDINNRYKKVMQTFVNFGANESILYDNKPHIGTDKLRIVVQNIRKYLKELGVEFKYNTCLTNINIANNHIKSIEVNNKEIIDTDILILAIGNSARDTIEMLYNSNLNIESKPFAVGLRIEHPQKLINYSQYGYEYHPQLPPAIYKLIYKSKNNRGVYTFCMCPGGYIINASSELNKTVINGMSNFKRDTDNANSAIIVTVDSKDYGTEPLDGIKYQRNLEEKTYNLTKGKIPIQLYKDFKDNKSTTKLGKVSPIFKGQYQLTNLNNILPDYISNSIKEAIEDYSRKIKNFNIDDAILAGIETRTSSPVRILRDENYESNIKGIYPCGEGSGYSGGITTSAIDGIKVAEQIIKIYH